MPDSLPTAANLTKWLRHSGTLPAGTISDVRVALEHKTDISRLVFLTLMYSPDVPQGLPRFVVVKSPLVRNSGQDYSHAESQFYRLLAPALGSPPVVRCLAAIDDAGESAGTVVLEDLRATHDHPPWPIPPSMSQCEIAIDALARVHTQWWEAPSLGITVGTLHTPESLTNMLQGITKHLPAFMDAFGPALTSQTRQLYERVFGSALLPWLRLTDSHALTIIHGDAHTWNFLFPRDGKEAAFLIDWQLWHVDLGARDLAFLMALHWPPSRRREYEAPLISRYHEALLANGIDDYGLDELWLDYRRSVIRNLTIPIIFWSRGMKPEGWWNRLEFAAAAYHDLECEDLL
jgi:hypothetical protein